MRFVIEVDYAEDAGEDVGAVGRALAEIVIEQLGVRNVIVYGEEATVLTRTDHEPIVRGVDY